jgi:hypothetical protein
VAASFWSHAEALTSLHRPSGSIGPCWCQPEEPPQPGDLAWGSSPPGVRRWGPTSSSPATTSSRCGGV